MEKSNSFNTGSKNRPAYGIDLGTTNSCISVLGNSDVPKTIELSSGKLTMPSCVLWDSNKSGTDEEFIVGDKAYYKRWRSNACYSVKRLMGSGKKVTFKHGNRTLTMTPAEVSALILKGLVKKASDVYKDIEDVVITVPAGFGTKEIEDTKKAAEIAGLNVLNIMREPTAASVCYKLDKKSGNILVYDLGGGTFDVSLVKVTLADNSENAVLAAMGIASDAGAGKDTINVIDTRGDLHLGGDDLDREMYKYLEKAMEKEGIPVKLIPKEEKEKLILRLESHKKIKDFSSVKMDLDFTLTNGEKVNGYVIFTKDYFEKATFKIFQKTKKYIDDLLQSNNVNIDSIVLVGGSTKNEYLKGLLKKTYSDCEIYDYLNPDESVAQGAAINAKRLKFGSDNFQIFDVTSNSIGVLSDGRISRMIEKSQSIPVTSSRMFSTTKDNQEFVRVEIYEGESVYPENNQYLGDLVIEGLPKAKAGEVGVQVTLQIDNNGLLTCTTTVDKTTKQVSLVNVLGKKVEKVSTDSIKFKRWESFANSLDDESAKDELLSLIEDAKVDKEKERDVIDFIRQIKQSKNNDEEKKKLEELETFAETIEDEDEKKMYIKLLESVKAGKQPIEKLIDYKESLESCGI